MSKIANALLTLDELFHNARMEFEFWEKELSDNGYDVENAIAAAQYYGQMTAIANVEKQLFENGPCQAKLELIKPKLYKDEYN